jgi:predicted DNA binding CopG/RHH family protein
MRRKATTKKNVRLTDEGIGSIQAWATEHGLSFSAALETAALLGIKENPTDALAPALMSLMKSTIRTEYDRLIRLVLFNIVETGFSSRMASAAVRMQEPDLERFIKIREAARADARRSVARGKIAVVIGELLHGNSED